MEKLKFINKHTKRKHIPARSWKELKKILSITRTAKKIFIANTPLNIHPNKLNSHIIKELLIYEKKTTVASAPRYLHFAVSYLKTGSNSYKRKKKKIVRRS